MQLKGMMRIRSKLQRQFFTPLYRFVLDTKTLPRHRSMPTVVSDIQHDEMVCYPWDYDGRMEEDVVSTSCATGGAVDINKRRRDQKPD